MNEAERLAKVLGLAQWVTEVSPAAIAERIFNLEHMLDFAIPTWRTPRDDGHDLEVATIGLQRQELEQLRKRVMELEEEHQVLCPECGWHGFHKPGCTRSVAPYVDDNPQSPF
jgi:hypothetical protein